MRYKRNVGTYTLPRATTWAGREVIILLLAYVEGKGRR